MNERHLRLRIYKINHRLITPKAAKKNLFRCINALELLYILQRLLYHRIHSQINTTIIFLTAQSLSIERVGKYIKKTDAQKRIQ